MAEERARLRAQNPSGEVSFRITPEKWAEMDTRYVATGSFDAGVADLAVRLVSSALHASGDVRGKEVRVSVTFE